MNTIADTFDQVAPSTLRVTRTLTSTTTTTMLFTYEDLLNQQRRVQEKKDLDNAARDIELLEITGLIEQCIKLQITGFSGDVIPTTNSLPPTSL